MHLRRARVRSRTPRPGSPTTTVAAERSMVLMPQPPVAGRRPGPRGRRAARSGRLRWCAYEQALINTRW